MTVADKRAPEVEVNFSTRKDIYHLHSYFYTKNLELIG